jgi:hypothetical protein
MEDQSQNVKALPVSIGQERRRVSHAYAQSFARPGFLEDFDLLGEDRRDGLEKMTISPLVRKINFQ